MKSFVKSLVTALTLGVMASALTLNAQPPDGQKKGGGRGGQTPEARYEAIETAVGKLTADQKTKIMAILTKAAADRQALPQEDRRGPKGQELTAATNKEIAAVLTKEQAEKFAAMPAPGRGGGGGGKKQN